MTKRKLNTIPARPDPEVRRRRDMWGIARSVLMLIALTGLCVWMSLRPGSSSVIDVVSTMVARSRPPKVIEVVPATALYDTYRPVEATDVFHPADTFFVSVKLSDYRSGMELFARWKYEGRLITETTLNTDDVGEGYAGFSLINDNPPWSEGRYTVEIVYEGEVLGSADFRVEP